MFLSDVHNEESREWISLATGGLVGLTFVLLANVFQELIPFTDFFAVINIIFFVCVFFSPCLLFYGILGSDRRERSDVLVLISYLVFAPLIGLMIDYLARGDNYYSGLVMIPNELSWVVVTVIAILLLIPFINLFSSLPIAIWLGSLIYCKGYQSSYLFKALIGSPLFVLPLFVFLGYEICRAMRAHQEEGYVFDKVSGELTPHRLPRGRTPLKKILAITSLFLIASSALVTGFATWNELEETRIVRLSDFQAFSEISHEGSYLMASFSLINARNKTTTVDGIAELSIYDKNGSLIYKDKFNFSQKDFRYSNYMKWVLTYTVPGESFLAAVISKDISVADLATSRLRDSIGSGYAALKVSINNGEKILTATCSLRFYCETETLIRLYYQNEIKKLQLEFDRQWPFKVSISNYLRIGNYCWAVVGRTGGEIIFYPDKIYNCYILQSKDGGYGWDIAWKGDNYPLFKAEFLSEKEIQITTPYAIFRTCDGGETWE
jgi:hypothetical protein